nr:uncharacterized protein LOC124812766 [Hydra vulgaris]
MKLKEIAEEVEISVSATRFISDKICKGLSDDEIASVKKGRRSSYDETLKSEIRMLIEHDPSHTLASLRNILVERNINASIPTISKYLKSMEFTRKRLTLVPKERNSPQNIDLRQSFCRTINSIPDNNLVFLDETGFNLHTSKQYRYSIKNTKCFVTVPANRGKNVSLMAAITVNVLDNCAFHRRRDVINLLSQSSVSVYFLPPYSPQLNPIEEYYSCLKANYTSIRPFPKTSNEVKATLNSLKPTIGVDFCESANDWNTALDNHQITDVVYIDFQKASDSVSHTKLLVKLSSYNIKGNLLNWISSFVTNRYQQVKVGNSISNSLRIVSGVPQGSVLVPTLFLFYVNDLTAITNNLDCCVKLYVDDIKLYSLYCDMDLSQDLVVVLNRLLQWAETWQLTIACSKCFALRIAPPSLCKGIKVNYKLGEYSLVWSSNPKDLGVTMGCNLNYKKHIFNVIHQANSRAYLILKCFKTCDPCILVRDFTTYIRPILEYCSPVWSPHQIRLIKSVESVQQKFTKKIRSLINLYYHIRLQLLGIESLEVQRLKNHLVTCFAP